MMSVRSNSALSAILMVATFAARGHPQDRLRQPESSGSAPVFITFEPLGEPGLSVEEATASDTWVVMEDGSLEPISILDDGDFGQLESCCCGCCCNRVQRESCVDWFLPRSHLPLPLMKELAEDRDITLPLPLGAGFVWNKLYRHVVVDDLRLGFGNTPPESVDRVDVEETVFHTSTKIARVDLWVFPFLNVRHRWPHNHDGTPQSDRP